MQATKMTITEAAQHPQRAFMALDDLILDIPLGSLIDRLAWCVGAENDQALYEACCADLRGDASLCIALHSEPQAFKAWLMQEDKSIYFLTETSDSLDWYLFALDRLNGLVVWPAHSS